MIKGKMSVSKAIRRILESKPNRLSSWDDLYQRVPKIVGYNVDKPFIRSSVYRYIPARHKNPLFIMKNINGLPMIKLLKSKK